MPNEDEGLDRFRSAYTSITELLLSIRRGLERATEHAVFREDGSFQKWRACQLEIEGLRISFRRARGFVSRRESVTRASPIIAEFFDEIEHFKKSDNFRSISQYRAYFLQNGRASENNLDLFVEGLNIKEISIGEALELISKITKDILSVGQSMMPGLTPVANLRRIVPAQSIAPVQFIVANGKIRVKNINSKLAEEDEANVQSARHEVLRKGEDLIDELKKSNADPRLIGSFIELQCSIQDNHNVIAVGLANIACELIGVQCGHELSDPLVIRIQAHARSVEMYAAQFSDWRRFVENAALTHIDMHAMDQIHIATAALITKLNDDYKTVDPGVPKTLSTIMDLYRKPSGASKKIAFALLKSVENLFSAMFTFSAEVMQETAAKSKEKFAKHASTVIVLSFLGFATSFISPLPSPLKEVGWIKAALDLVISQIKQTEK